MSLSEKANLLRQLVDFVVTILPKIVDLIIEIFSALKEIRANA